ncbi:MAG TPA: thioredoxin family protein [Rhodanobacter sp.]|nr:thioredoxin family protein [Rhodanobacter sp.]
MNSPTIATRAAWLEARKALFEKERAMTHQLEALHAERRRLPWVRIDKRHTFQGPEGAVELGDLFGRRSQLAIYHFMLAPGSHHVCPGCSLLMDHVDAARRHFEHADLAFAAVSRAPVERIEEVRRRMDWTFRWVSSAESDFNYDFGVSFTEADRAAGRASYNYGLTSITNSPDMFGVSIFAKDDGGEIFHTYSTYHRGVELLVGAFNWLDLAPRGRNETEGTMSWVRLHDQYED